MSADPARAIADAVLYEGYILWPYRRSALKNQRRFTFGGVFPPAHARAHPDDPARMQTEVLVRSDASAQVGDPAPAQEPARVEVTVRFLHVVERTIGRRKADGELEPVDELVVEGERFLSWEEAAEREIEVPANGLRTLQRGVRAAIEIPAGRALEELPAGAGAAIRTWQALSGEVQVSSAPVGADAWRLSVRIVNATPLAGGIGAREGALKRTFCSTHTVLRVTGGEFVSQTDPPPELAGAAAGCRNAGTWPVLVGDPGVHGTVLSSPIILEDHPRVAPESPGDLFDGGEIDQLLILNILALTDEEKAEMAATDPRAREILERTEGLDPEQLVALHGTIRDFGIAR